MISLTTIRAKPISIGKNNKVLFQSVLEKKPFSLVVNLENLHKLHLHTEYDLEVKISRNEENDIIEGEVLKIHVIDTSVDAWFAWREWYRKVNR